MITYRFIKYLILNIKYSRILNEIYEKENLIDNLSSLFKVQFKKDWIGRIYAVFNPHIQDGIFDINNQIYEYDKHGLSNRAHVEAYIMNQLNIAKGFIMANNLFDLLTYDIKQLDEYDNYLFIIKPITLDDCLKYTKLFSLLIIIVGLITCGFLIYFL